MRSLNIPHIALFTTFLVLSCLGISPLAVAADCSRDPDYRTPESAAQPQLTGLDPFDKEFEFYSRSVALVIGESKYEKWRPLPSVPQEMDRLTAALEAGGFEVYRYSDLNGKDIRDVVSCFMVQKVDRTGMRLLLFLAGHGATRTVLGQQVGYVVPIDAPATPDEESLNSPDFLTKAVTLNQFVSWAGETEAKHSLFIFDICFGGAILNSRGSDVERSAKPSNYVFSDQVNQPLREFMASGSADQEVPDPSTFLDLLVRALLGEAPEADSNRDGYITGTELATYLQGWVPKYIPNQTPAVGRIRDAALDKGEFIFKIPTANQSAIQAQTGSVLDGTIFRPVYRGTVSGERTSTAAQEYELEGLLTTSPSECTQNCEDTAKSYTIQMQIPDTLPGQAVLDQVELRCVSGNCGDSFKLVDGPSISADKRSAIVVFRAWGASGTWRLTAKVFTPSQPERTAIYDPVQRQLVSVSPENAAIESSKSEDVDLTSGDIASILENLESDTRKIRRSARIDLAAMLSNTSADAISRVVRQIPTGSYRYRLGVVDALSRVKGGWTPADSISIRIVAGLAGDKDGDPTLTSVAQSALSNSRVYAYYEVGNDGWLTRNGQLKPLLATRPPLPGASHLAPGIILQAASEVFLRTGPSRESAVASILGTGECVRLIKSDDARNGDDGWLQVAPARCR